MSTKATAKEMNQKKDGRNKMNQNYYDASITNKILRLADCYCYIEAIELLKHTQISESDAQYIFENHIANEVSGAHGWGNTLRNYQRDIYAVTNLLAQDRNLFFVELESIGASISLITEDTKYHEKHAQDFGFPAIVSVKSKQEYYLTQI